MRGSLFGTSRPGRRARTRPRNPLLERLEERRLLALIPVTSTGDLDAQGNPVPGSLRQAIIDANTNGGQDTIQFAITGSGVQTITPSRDLPAITGSVIIDATTQPGYSGTPLIEINGINAGNTTNGLRISSSDVTISGLAINNFGASGIRIEANQVIVDSCYIGTTPSGTQANPNGGSGITIANASSSVIRGNVLSGNTGPGLTISGSSSSNRVFDNFIGTTSGGGGALPNSVGILISGGNSNQIGGELPDQGNVISGNAGSGVQIAGINSTNNRILNNNIGTNSGATLAVPNGGAGVQVTGSAFTRIGGSAPDEGNIISGNAGPGISLTDAASTTIQGNQIGTNGGGTADLGNGDAGVLVAGANSAGTVVGGTASGAGNTIRFNGKNPPSGTQSGGVVVTGGAVVPILSNSIDANNGLGIDIGADGPSGGTSPTITQAATASGRTLVQGFFNGQVGTAFLVQFFTQPTADPSGFGEGRTLIGSATVTTDINGVGTINSLLSSPSVVGNFLSATVTAEPSQTSATSEFSRSAQITAAQIADLAVAITDSPDPATQGSSLTYTITVTNRGPDAATNVQFTQQIPTSMTITGVTSSQGVVTPGSGNVISGNLGTIADDQVVTITVTVTPTNVGTFETSASATAAQIDTNNENNSDVESTFVNVPADVAVSFQNPEPEGVADRVLSFEILVFNKVTPESDGTATNVIATADFLDGFMDSGLFLGAFTGQGTVTVDGDTVTFNIGTIQPGNTVALRIDLLLSASNNQVQIPHDVPLTVSVSSNEIDPDSSNNTASATASFQPESDLSVGIATSPESVLFDGMLTYTVTAQNNGPDASPNVQVVFAIPESEAGDDFEFTAITASDGGVVVVDGSTITVTFPSIAAQGSATLTFQIQARNRPGYNATAEVSSDASGDLNPGNDKASLFTAVDAADVQIASVTTTPANGAVGQPLTYTVVLRNAGPGTATTFTYLGTLGAGLQFGEVTSTRGTPSFSSSTGTITLALASLAAGEEVRVTIVATPLVQGVVQLTNIAIADNPDVQTGDNYLVTNTLVNPADVSVTLTASTSSILVGSPVTYTAVVTNNGPEAAPAVGFLDVLPAGLTLVSATTSKGTIGNFGGTIAAQLGTLASGESVTITLTVLPLAEGTVTQSVLVGSDAFDSVPDNNAATVDLEVTNVPGVIAIADASFTAPENAGSVRVTLTRTSGTKGAVAVRYSIEPGTAVPGVNFAPVSDFVTFADGQTTATFDVPLIVDGVTTGPLTARIVLSEPQGGATLGDRSSAALTITNTDVDLVPPTVTDLSILGPPTAIGGVVLTFSEGLDPLRAFDPANYAILRNGSPVPLFAPNYNAAARTVTLIPTAPLPVGSTFYTLLVNGSAPTGVTDPAGNPLPNGGFVGSFGRGSNLGFVDGDGDRVGLRLQGGGYLDAVLDSNGNAQVLRIVGPTTRTRSRPVLTGTVRRSGGLGNGVTTIGQIQSVNAGAVRSRLTTPPFYVSSQLQTPLSALTVGASFPRNSAAARVSGLRGPRG